MDIPQDTPPPSPETATKAKAMSIIGALGALYPEARNMLTDERRRSLGRLVYRHAALYGQLFQVIEVSKVRAAFDALGAKDDGEDPNRFETEVLQARLARVAHLSAVSTALRTLADRLDDEALHVGASTALPAILALELARVIAKSNETFRGAIAPVLDGFSAMTVSARRALAAAREGDAAAADPGSTQAEPSEEA